MIKKILGNKRKSYILAGVLGALFFFVSMQVTAAVSTGAKGPTSPKATFNAPHYVAIAPNGNVYVADSGNNMVRVFDYNGNSKFNFGTKGSLPGQMEYPDGIAISPSGEVFVGEIGNQRIQVFSLDGKYLREFKTHRKYKPGVIVFDRTDLYVADLTHQEIAVYGQNGKLKTAIGKPGSGDGELAFPSGIYIRDNLIFVADSNNSRIQVFNRNGGYVKKIGDSSAGPDSTVLPVGIGGYGNQIYVVDAFTHQVKVFGLDGKSKSTYGSIGTTVGKFSFPEGLTVDAKGFLYVVDTGNNRVQVISLPTK